MSKFEAKETAFDLCRVVVREEELYNLLDAGNCPNQQNLPEDTLALLCIAVQWGLSSLGYHPDDISDTPGPRFVAELAGNLFQELARQAMEAHKLILASRSNPEAN